MLRNFYYALSPELRFFARKIYYFPIDLYEGFLGKRHKYQPKKGDIYIGSGDFLQQGKNHLHYLKKYQNLSPKDHVLDIGCGIGRTATALTTFLDKEGGYDGFDVVKKGIDWCNKTISKDFSNFRFLYVPLSNDLYTKDSKKAIDFVFPYPDNTFDQCFLFSVFTHMQPNEIAHYLNEIYRVLKKDGQCLATFFIYDDKITDYQKSMFPIDYHDYRLMNERVKSANIAFNSRYLDVLFKNSQLQKSAFIKGYWTDFSTKSKDRDYQDIILLKK